MPTDIANSAPSAVWRLKSFMMNPPSSFFDGIKAREQVSIGKGFSGCLGPCLDSLR
jgi:hypothetical protein